MGKVIYISGAPATGKSTLCKSLAAGNNNINIFCYSERLRDYINRNRGERLDEESIRRESAGIVTAADVSAVDDILVAEVDAARKGGPTTVIDSHPLTKESFGFRITPFYSGRLRMLKIDALICLYADPMVLHQRITVAPQGRPLPSYFDLSLHVQLQAAIVTQYAILIEKPCYIIDSNIPRDALLRQVNNIIVNA